MKEGFTVFHAKPSYRESFPYILLLIFVQRLRNLTLPTKEWGPALVKHRRLVDYVRGFVVDPWETGTRKLDKQGMENWGMVYSISTQDIKVHSVLLFR